MSNKMAVPKFDEVISAGTSDELHALDALLDPKLEPLFHRPFLLDRESAWFGHIPFAHWIVRATRPGLFVELGTHAGVSYAAFCSAVHKEKTQTRCFAVDHWKGDPQAGFYDEQTYASLRAFNEKHFGHFSTLLRSTFDEAIDCFEDQSIDLLHIDGFHTYEAVSHDFDTWLPKLSDKAVILFHDTNEYGKDFGVWRLWSELRERYPSFEFLHSHGLGVLAVGRSVPQALAGLCALNDSTSIATVRERFESFGARWALEARQIHESKRHTNELANINREKGDALERAKRAEARVASLEKENARMTERGKAAEARVASLENDNARVTERVKTAEAHAASLEKENARVVESAAYAEVRAASLETEKTRIAECAASIEARVACLEAENARALSRAKLAGKRAARAQQQITEIVSSSSWRLTAPLRIAGRLLPKPLRYPLRRSLGLLRLVLHPRATVSRYLAFRRTYSALRASGLFDQKWYLSRYPDVAAAGMDPIAHYLKRGVSERRNPSADFDTGFYFKTYPDVRAAGVNPLYHYIIAGQTEGRLISLFQLVCATLSASPLFDRAWYLAQYPDVAAAGLDPVPHYVEYGASEGRNPAETFDTRFYLDTYPDVRESGMNPLYHYIIAGQTEGRLVSLFQLVCATLSASPLFDRAWYLAQYPDIAAAGLDPVPHYVEYGASEGRNPAETFDTRFYLDTYPDVRESGMNPLYHYIIAGQTEGRLVSLFQLVCDTLNASPLFDREWYLAEYPDVAAAVLDPVQHYVEHGASEGRNPSKTFDTRFYLDTYPNVRAAGVNPLYHYITAGQREGRRARAIAPSGANTKEALKGLLRSGNQPISYGEWIVDNDTLGDHDRILIRRHIGCFKRMPSFSILMPVFDPVGEHLRQALDSVVAQIYGNWELCVIGNAATSPEIRNVFNEFASMDERIKPYLREVNGGIPEYANAALDLASGDWVVLMDDNELLSEHALYLLAEAIDRDPDLTIVYSDEDRIDAVGRRSNHYFKPDWDYDLFLGRNLIGHLAAYRADLARQAGGFREGFEGAHDWDFALRILEAASSPIVRHVPFILCHRRIAVDTVSDTSIHAVQRTVNEHLARTGQAAQAHLAGYSNHLHIRRELPAQPPLVSIVIPTKDQCGLLRTCIDGILNRTDYQPVEIIIVDNGSSAPDALEFLAEIKARQNIRVLEDSAPFNFSRLVNRGVAASLGEICVLLNNDVDVISPNWLRELVSHTLRPEVGAVGAKLHYANDTLQHGGVILGTYNVAGSVGGHAHRTALRHFPGYGNRLNLVHSLSCVTGACLATRREVYDAVGGFNEQDLAVSFNDVDFCLRVREAGYKVIWTPHAELYHYESLSRGDPLATPKKASQNGAERAYMRRRWGSVLDNDPYYNPNLSLDSSSFELSRTPRTRRPWTKLQFDPGRNLEEDVAMALQLSAGAAAYRSVAYRLSHIKAYEVQISEYLRIRCETPSKEEKKFVIYTAICGGYDSVKLPESPDPRFDYVLFTDTPVPDTGVYQVWPITYCHADATRSARFVKTHPHMLLAEYDLAIWIDANIMIVGDMYPLIDEFLASGKALGAVPHPMRKSVYEEGEACIFWKTDNTGTIREQLAYYRGQGFEHDDLIESNLLVFDLNDHRTKQFLDTWWTQIDRHSRRDQLSLNYALKQTGVEWHPLMKRPNSVRNHPNFELVRHDTCDGAASALIEALEAPVADPYAGPAYTQVRNERIAAQKQRRIDIVVCVHNALEDVRRCLETLVNARTSEQQRLILVDDGSDQVTAHYIETFAQLTPRCELLRNQQARGYTKAANKGLAASTGEFVILLNSDTLVTDGWAEKMADAVFSTPGAGIVGPMSNAASHQSIPEHRGSSQQTAVNELPPGLTAEDMNRYCERWTAAHVLPRVPLVHGFCFGLTREVIEKVGLFDEASFPRGYGEENDYCLRAVNLGFSLVIATHTFIYHAKSKSYAGPERIALMQSASETLTRLHGRPRVQRAVRSMEENPVLVDLRKRARHLTDSGA